MQNCQQTTLLLTNEKETNSRTLKDRFLVNPFSIFDTKTKYWQDKKHAWEDIIKDKENNCRFAVQKDHLKGCASATAITDKANFQKLKSPAGISTFDPFLTEILIKWFSNAGNTVLDPFAGGIVRGAVTALCDRNYIGVDVSEKQIEHNKKQWETIASDKEICYTKVKYICDSTENLTDYNIKADFILSCPPYWNLEKYSDNSADLSTINDYPTFYAKYEDIIQKCYNALNDNSFACFVVGEVRDKSGAMVGFVSDTIKAFQKAGFKYYNEMILELPIAGLSLRAGRVFAAGRKIGKHHQNVLVFYKGNMKIIKNKFHEVV